MSGEEEVFMSVDTVVGEAGVNDGSPGHHVFVELEQCPTDHVKWIPVTNDNWW